jgi:hypothetical protein
MISTDVMIDIETLSTTPNALILTIAAIKFDRSYNIKPMEEMEIFYKRISKASGKKLNMHIDEKTRNWWLQQPKEIQYEALYNKNDRIDIADALSQLAEFVKGSNCIWSHGDDFDCVILSEAYKTCKMEIPWKFWQTRDTRTLFDIANLDYNKEIIINKNHHALYDCYRQIMGVKKSLEKLRY